MSARFLITDGERQVFSAAETLDRACVLAKMLTEIWQEELMIFELEHVASTKIDWRK